MILNATDLWFWSLTLHPLGNLLKFCSWFGRSGWGLRVCTLNTLPGDAAAAAGPEKTLWGAQSRPQDFRKPRDSCWPRLVRVLTKASKQHVLLFFFFLHHFIGRGYIVVHDNENNYSLPGRPGQSLQLIHSNLANHTAQSSQSFCFLSLGLYFFFNFLFY